jgi:tetratricopeptide (TPR) repeat protein
MASGNLELARTRLDAGMEILVGRLGRDHPDVGDATLAQGRLQMEERHPLLAAASFERALEIRRESLGEDAAGVAEARLELARAQAAGGNVDAAIETLEGAVGERGGKTPADARGHTPELAAELDRLKERGPPNRAQDD